MKKCLEYMSDFWGWDKYEIVLGIILLALFQKNGFLIFCIIYAINAMSLSIYYADTGLLNKGGRHDKLTFSLPMSRKTVYDSRMCFVAIMYIVSVVASVIPYNGKYFDYMFSVLSFLFGHIVCGVCIRKPNLQIVSGLPVLIVLILLIMCSWIDKLEYLLGQIESSVLSLAVMGIICAVMIAIDVYVWHRERRIFINGSPKGNVIRKEKRRTNEKYYGIEKKKIIIRTIIALVIFGAPISASLSKDFMLRAAVFPVSPQSALTMEYEYYKDLPNRDNAKLYIITKNIPVEKETQGELYTWVVYNYGPFHFAKYYGEG